MQDTSPLSPPDALDLSSAGVKAFYEERDPTTARAVGAMESVETWTLDRHRTVQEALHSLATRLGSWDLHHMPLQAKDDFVVLMGYLATGKALRLLLWLDDKNPGFVATALAEAQWFAASGATNPQAAQLLVERFTVLERMHLLCRVFAEDRIALVQQAIRILSGEEDLDLSDSDIDGVTTQ